MVSTDAPILSVLRGGRLEDVRRWQAGDFAAKVGGAAHDVLGTIARGRKAEDVGPGTASRGRYAERGAIRAFATWDAT
jgi:hypothetical protein